MWNIISTGLLLISVVNCQEYSWSKLDYNFPNESMREKYKASEDFIQENNVPVGITVYKDKMFMAVSRWRKGVAANLNYVPISDSASEKQSPKLTPYPSWEANDVHSNDEKVIISTYRIRVDACDRLWGVDSGLDDVLGESKKVRPLRLIVVDLKTDQIIRTYKLKDSDQTEKSIFTDLAVDVDKDSCDNAYAYLADPNGYGLVVYSWAQNNSWRFKHHYFTFHPLYGDYNISGVNFQWADGIFGLALSNPDQDGTKTLYFHPNAGINVFSVPNYVLKNESNVEAKKNFHMFKLEGEKGPMTQGTSIAMDMDTEIIYFTLLNKHGIACWDTRVPLNPATFKLIAQDDEILAFPNDVTIDPVSRKLYILMNNMPKLIFGKIGPKDKYNIYSMSLDALTNYCRSDIYNIVRYDY